MPARTLKPIHARLQFAQLLRVGRQRVPLRAQLEQHQLILYSRRERRWLRAALLTLEKRARVANRLRQVELVAEGADRQPAGRTGAARVRGDSRRRHGAQTGGVHTEWGRHLPAGAHLPLEGGAVHVAATFQLVETQFARRPVRVGERPAVHPLHRMQFLHANVCPSRAVGFGIRE